MAFRALIATIPIGLSGFNGSKNAAKLGPGHFSYVEGVDIDGEVLVKDGGAEKLNVSALAAAVLSGMHWTPAPGNLNDVVVLANGQIRRDVGLGTFPTLMATINAPVLYPPHFVKAGGEAVGATRKLFVFSDSDQVQVISGTAATANDISTPPADWAASFPTFGVQHAQRLWGGGNASDPHRIYYSTVGDHQDFTGAGSGTFSIYPGEGDQIVGGLSFRGLLVLFKYPKGIYVVDTRDPAVANWSVQKLNSAVGAAGPHCIVQISNDVLVLDTAGNFHLMSTINDFSDVSTSDVGRKQNIAPFMREQINLLGMRKAVGVWYASKAKAWFMVPLIGSNDNNLRIMLDFNNPNEGARFYLSRRDVGKAMWMRPNPAGVEKPVLGDEDGFVWLMDTEERNKDGVAYTMRLETSDNDFAHVDPELSARTKNGAYLEITADIVRNSFLNVTPIWDGFPGQPMIITLGSQGAALDAFVLDIDVLAAAGTVTVGHRLNGQGRRLKLVVENNVLDDEVRISEFKIGFGVADERIRND